MNRLTTTEVLKNETFNDQEAARRLKAYIDKVERISNDIWDTTEDSVLVLTYIRKALGVKEEA